MNRITASWKLADGKLWSFARNIVSTYKANSYNGYVVQSVGDQTLINGHWTELDFETAIAVCYSGEHVCRCCEQLKDYHCAPWELEAEGHFCGGSERCVP